MSIILKENKFFFQIFSRKLIYPLQTFTQKHVNCYSITDFSTAVIGSPSLVSTIFYPNFPICNSFTMAVFILKNFGAILFLPRSSWYNIPFHTQYFCFCFSQFLILLNLDPWQFLIKHSTSMEGRFVQFSELISQSEIQSILTDGSFQTLLGYRISLVQRIF